MIIGFDASRAFSSNRTGTENYSYHVLRNLARIDHNNQYVVYLRPPISLKIVQSSFSWPSNFKFLILNSKLLWTQFGLAKQTFRDKLDVLFVPAHTLPLIRKPGLQTVVTIHDLGAEYLPKTHQLKQRAYLKLMIDFQLKSATHLIAVSQATKDDLIKKIHIDPQKVSVIYEGYDKTAFKPLKIDQLKDTLNQYDIEYNNYFFFIGTIQPRKNLERLIKAYAKFLKQIDDRRWKMEDSSLEIENREINSLSSNYNRQKSTLHPLPSTVKLILAGSKGWLSDEIYELPKKLGIEKHVKFLGYVPDKNLPALYSGAIALLYPSLFEGFGLPILEAMACETPVLTSNISSMPEIAGKAAILVNPYSEEEIAQGIYNLFSDQKLKNQLKSKGIAQSTKFSWEKCARETLKVLETT